MVLTGSALSNASALWSLIAVLISVILRRTYPGGVLARDYDVTGDKKEKKDKYRVHPASGKDQNSSLVYPVCEVDGDGEDLEGGPSGERRKKAAGGDVPPEGCEMVGRDGKPVPPPSAGQTAQGSQASQGSASAPPADDGGSVIRTQKDKDEHDGYCTMCLDECTAC